MYDESPSPKSDPIDSVLKDFDRANTLRDPWLSMWQDCYDYAIPSRGEGFYTTNPGESRTDKLYDETAVVSLQEFASRMQAGLVPNFTRWAILEAGSEVQPERADEINSQLEEVTKYVFDVIYNSNFAQEAHECFLDLGIGTGGLLVEEGNVDHPVKFTAIPLTQLVLSSGPMDMVDKVFRQRKMKGEDILPTWRNAKLPDAMKREIRDDPRREYTIVEATCRDWDNVGDEVHNHFVICKEHKLLLHKAEYKGTGSNPWVVFRWSKCAGETYGRGPLLNSLAAIRTVNAVVELVLRNADMAISGMWQVEDDGVINVDAIQLVPGTVIPYGHDSRGLTPLQSGGSFDVSQLVLNDMRANIKRLSMTRCLARSTRPP